MHKTFTSIAYTGKTSLPGRMPLREFFLLIGYHIRLLNWWLFLLMGLGFLGSGAIFWFEVRSGTPLAMGNGAELSRFVMESGAGLIAGMLASSLIVGDPALEVTMITRTGILHVLIWRYLLTCMFLLVTSAIYLCYTLTFKVISTHVVEDISQTCDQIAVLNRGELAFHGRTRQLIDAAIGHSWQFLADSGYTLPATLSIISVLPQMEGTLYRVVGPRPEGAVREVQQVPPTLEDGYVFLRQQCGNDAGKSVKSTV